MGDAQVGLQARLMSQALRKLTGVVSKSRTCLIFINQLREKIGVMFGNPETTTGGRALKFYSSVRIDIRRIGAIKDGDRVIGGRTRVKVVKNKLAPPFRQAEFDVVYGEGISREGDLLDLAVDRGIVEKSGTWFSYGGERMGQGRENVKRLLKEKPELYAAIELAGAQRAGTRRRSGSRARLRSGQDCGPLPLRRHDRVGRLIADDEDLLAGPDQAQLLPRDGLDGRGVLPQAPRAFPQRVVPPAGGARPTTTASRTRCWHRGTRSFRARRPPRWR